MAARDLIFHLKDMAAMGMAHMAHSGPNNRADRMIDYLRTRIVTAMERTASIHNALGIATLIVLLIEAVINFRPKVNRLRLKEQRADHAEDELAYLAHHDALSTWTLLALPARDIKRIFPLQAVHFIESSSSDILGRWIPRPAVSNGPLPVR